MRRRIRFLMDRAVIVLGLFVMCLVVKAGMFGVALLTWGSVQTLRVTHCEIFWLSLSKTHTLMTVLSLFS